MNKKVLNGLLICFIALLVVSMLFGQSSPSNSVDSQISNFDKEISASAVIEDGNIEDELIINKNNNKLSKANASISIQIEKAVQKLIDLINQILKKIVS